jgi:sialate O-acetylesterase
LAVRYAWSNAPEANLFSGSGLPAAPFRSDSW